MLEKTTIKLLYIDDSVTNHYIVKTLLVNTHIEYTGCSSSAEARKILEDNYFDVIAQDVIRADDDMDGFAMTRWIRKFCPNVVQRDVPVIIISDISSEDLEKHQQKFHYNAFFSPVFINRKLIKTIQKFSKTDVQ